MDKGIQYQVMYGQNLGNIINSKLRHRKTLLVTNQVIWGKYQNYLELGDVQVKFTTSMEADQLESEHQALKEFDMVVGMGGGMALDIAKFHAWKSHQPLLQIPTAISMDAMFSYPIALRYHGMVTYLGEKIPDQIFCDFDILLQAPKIYNRSGICDLLSCHTALFDWKLSASTGKCNLDQALYNAMDSKLKEIIDKVDEIAEVSQDSIKLLMNGYQFVAEENYRVGHCQFEEGSEHFFYYCLEALTQKTFVHGQVINLGILLMSILQNNQVDMIIDVLKRAKVPLYPRSMGISYQDLERALYACKQYVEENLYSYSILNHKPISSVEVNQALDILHKEFDPYSGPK
jgi:glycerol-1-phosphate dehydrogenase [NAD(P)+]